MDRIMDGTVDGIMDDGSQKTGRDQEIISNH